MGKRIEARIEDLERLAPRPDKVLHPALPDALAQRVAESKAAGTFPASLSHQDRAVLLDALREADANDP